MNPSGPILLFDGVCNLCNALVRFIIKIDTGAKIMFAPLESPSGRYLLGKYDLPAGDIDSVVFIVGNKCFLRSSAVLHLLRSLGGGWKLFYGLIIIPKFIRDFFYNLIARTRYKIFGKTDTCSVSSLEVEKRFFQ